MSDTRLTLLLWILTVHTLEVFNVATEAHLEKNKWPLTMDAEPLSAVR